MIFDDHFQQITLVVLLLVHATALNRLPTSQVLLHILHARGHALPVHRSQLVSRADRGDPRQRPMAFNHRAIESTPLGAPKVVVIREEQPRFHHDKGHKSAERPCVCRLFGDVLLRKAQLKAAVLLSKARQSS